MRPTKSSPSPQSHYFGLGVFERPEQGKFPLPYLALAELAAFVRQPVAELLARLEVSP